MAYGYYQPYQPYQQPMMYQQPVQDQLTQLRNQQPQQAQMAQPQMQPTQMSGANQDERIWVSSPSAAEAYLMAPNSFVRLWNSSEPVFYERRTDGQGRPYPMDTYRYSLEDRKNQSNSVANDIGEEFTDKLQKIENRLNLIESSIYGGGKHDSKSNSDDSTVQPVQK